MAIGIDKVYVKMINKPFADPIDLIFAISKKSVRLEKTFTDEYLNKFTREEKIRYIKEVAFSRHHISILEHASFTFEIWGVSRSMTHQAVRSRIASFLESSLRYNDPTKEDFLYIVPFPIRGNKEQEEEFNKDMEIISNMYKKWYLVGKEKGLEDSICKELGRTVLPQCSCTTYTFTMNLSSLLNLFAKRLCVRAEKEFRVVVDAIYNSVAKYIPEIVEGLTSYCEQHGYCPEGKGSCGRYPTIEDIKLGYYENLNK